MIGRYFATLLTALSLALAPAAEAQYRVGSAPGMTRSPLRSFLTAVTGNFAPGYISAVQSPYALYGAQRLRAAYTGPIYREHCSTDSSEVDVSPDANSDYVAPATLTALCPSGAITVSALYDQSGNSRTLSQATVANQPSIDPAQTVGGAIPIIFDGIQTSSALPGQTAVYKALVTATASLSRSSDSIFIAGVPITSLQNNSFIQATSQVFQQAVSNQRAALGTMNSGAVYGPATNPAPQAGPAVWGFTASTSTTTFYENGSADAVANATGATSMPDLRVGSHTSSGSLNGKWKMVALPIYATALSTSDAAAVVGSLNTACGFPTSFDYAVMFTGDSIMEGSGSTYLMNMPEILRGKLSKNARLLNMAIHGQTLATEYTNRVARFGSTFLSGLNNVAFVEASTNDLNGTAGATLYTNTTVPQVAYLKSLGFKVIVTTPLPKLGGTSSRETELQAYRAAVRGNAAGADYVLDLYANPVMGPNSATLDCTLYFDCGATTGIHPTSLGYRYLAGAPSGTYANQYTYYYALQQVLQAATANAGYVP